MLCVRPSFRYTHAPPHPQLLPPLVCPPSGPALVTQTHTAHPPPSHPHPHPARAALCFRDAVLAAETCEELFTPHAPHIGLALAGVEVVSNGSGSHHQLRKLNQAGLLRGGECS